MKIEELFEKLKVIESVTSSSWDIIREIVSRIEEVEIVEKGWLNYQKGHSDLYCLNLSGLSTWSSYDECRRLVFFLDEGNNLRCEARIYDKNEFLHVLNDRFYVNMILPKSFVCLIETAIESKLDLKASRAYEEYLESEKAKWMSEYKKKLLNKE